jgi:deazaflavin-dependent oxidoreductase (nitroreductase family)
VPPPIPLLRAVNPVVRLVLRSPLHRALSGRLMLLEYRGARSGRSYVTPVGYVRWDEDTILAFSSSGWWRSLRDGRRVRLRIRGRWREAAPSVVEDRDERADVLDRLVRRLGPRGVRRLYLGLSHDRPPEREELLRAADARAVVRFRLREPGRRPD